MPTITSGDIINGMKIAMTATKEQNATNIGWSSILLILDICDLLDSNLLPTILDKRKLVLLTSFLFFRILMSLSFFCLLVGFVGYFSSFTD